MRSDAGALVAPNRSIADSQREPRDDSMVRRVRDNALSATWMVAEGSSRNRVGRMRSDARGLAGACAMQATRPGLPHRLG
jgi:IS5 family transposase